MTVSATLFEAPGRPASAKAALNSRIVKVPLSAASHLFKSSSNLLGPSVSTNARICSQVNAAASSGFKPPNPRARTFSDRGEFVEVDIEVIEVTIICEKVCQKDDSESSSGGSCPQRLLEQLMFGKHTQLE